jgi:hypothetical protein
MTRLAALLLALSLVHSAQAQTVPPPAAAKAKPAAKKPSSPKAVAGTAAASGPCIGVFPLLGDRFEVKKIGITVFGNEFKEITVDNWGLDDLVVERVRAAVGPARPCAGSHMQRAPSMVTFRESGCSRTSTRRHRKLFDRPRVRRNASVTSS